MIDLFLDKLADRIQTAAGNVFYIKTDFRAWLSFAKTIARKDALINEVDFIYVDAVPQGEEKKECFELLLQFYQPETELPRNLEASGGDKVLDYSIDSSLIYAAFLEQYKIDLLYKPDGVHFQELHWHTFLALLSGLRGTKLNDVMSWRCWSGSTKTEYGKQMARLKAVWALPEDEAKAEEIERDLEAFNKLFEK